MNGGATKGSYFARMVLGLNFLSHPLLSVPAGHIVIGTQLTIENLRFVNLLQLKFEVNTIILLSQMVYLLNV